MTSPARQLPTVAPHLQLRHELGRGSMGSVWAAHHTELGAVAVKLIDPELVAEMPEVVERLRFEAEAVWRIESPHIARVHERGIAGETPYMVMELLEGETLESRLDAEGALPTAQCLWILEQMAWALSAAHAHGIVHRDLKPDNVFLCDQSTGVPLVKLLDFGIAKAPTSDDIQLTRPGALLGTPYYMSREQLLCSADVDHRADLWAFAVVAYEVLTGCVPFNGKNLAYLIRAVFEGTFEPVSALRPDLVDAGCAQRVDRWFERAFALELEERFATVEDMVQGLRAALPHAIEDEVSGIRRIVRDGECGKTVCWHPEKEKPPATTAPTELSHSEPAFALDDEPTVADIPMRPTVPGVRLVAMAAAAGIMLGSLAAFI